MPAGANFEEEGRGRIFWRGLSNAIKPQYGVRSIVLSFCEKYFPADFHHLNVRRIMITTSQTHEPNIITNGPESPRRPQKCPGTNVVSLTGNIFRLIFIISGSPSSRNLIKTRYLLSISKFSIFKLFKFPMFVSPNRNCRFVFKLFRFSHFQI